MAGIDWSRYEQVHANRRNLLIHLIAVPTFAVAFIAALLAFVGGRFVTGAALAGLCLLAMITEGRGHRLEAAPPDPFTGPGNFLRRWFTEQYYTFPLFVLSGRWWQRYRNAAP